MKIIYNIIRNKLAKILSGNSGKCEIQEDKILCYVNEDKLKKESKGPYGYNLIYSGVKVSYRNYHKISKNLSRYENLAKKYDLNKPIYYIIEDVVFDKKINFLMTLSSNSIVFKNCTFNGQIYIDSMDKLVFINNKYIAYEEKIDPFVQTHEFTIRSMEHINELIFIDDNLVTENGVLKLYLNAQNIHMLGTIFKDVSELNIDANNINMECSDITSEIANISSPNITLAESTITSGRVLIETEEEILKDIHGKWTIIKKEGQSKWLNDETTIRKKGELNNKSIAKKRVLKK